MPAVHASWFERALFALAFALLLALSWPGVEARAESDLAPSARELTSLSPRAVAAPTPTSAPAAATCKANRPLVAPERAAQQRMAMQRLAQLMQGEGGGVQVMNGRGLAYPEEGDPTVELMRIQLEASAANPRE